MIFHRCDPAKYVVKPNICRGQGLKCYKKSNTKLGTTSIVTNTLTGEKVTCITYDDENHLILMITMIMMMIIRMTMLTTLFSKGATDHRDGLWD